MWQIPAYVLLGIGVGAGVGLKGGTKEEVAAYATLTGITGYMAAQPGFWSGTAAALNWVRIGAPMATGGGTGIGFGAAAGGTGALTAVAGVTASRVLHRWQDRSNSRLQGIRRHPGEHRSHSQVLRSGDARLNGDTSKG